MQTKRPFAPAFINRLDRYLLLNKPEAWSARTHLVVYYGILFIALLTLIAFLVPDDPRTRSGADSWAGFVSLVSIVAIVGWAIYLLRFNVFKRYGLTSPVNRLITFALYFVSIGTFVLFCYVQPAVESIRANAAYTDEEIVNDINKVNLNVNWLEYDSLDHKWNEDTILITERAPVSSNELYDVDVVETADAYSRKRTKIEMNPKTFAISLPKQDSARKLNDSVYLFLRCPSYVFLYNYRARPDSVESLGAVDIYRQVVQNYKPPANKEQLRNELTAIRKKYRWEQWEDDTYNIYEYRTTIADRIRWRYGINDINDSMYNILTRKHRWESENLQILVRVFFYSTLVLCLLAFAFRHSTAKTFFLSILTAIILTILTSLMMVFSMDSSEIALFGYIIFYFIAALGISITAFIATKRNVVTGIAINIMLWMLPFMPLCAVALYYANLKRIDRFDYDKDYYLQEQYLFAAEIIGILLLIIMIGTYFHKIYRKWYAAPEH
jgi:hypothetical protein